LFLSVIIPLAFVCDKEIQEVSIKKNVIILFMQL
jgi:hypothetical protein